MAARVTGDTSDATHLAGNAVTDRTSAPGACGSVDAHQPAEEVRSAADERTYTYSEFIAYYGEIHGPRLWEERRPASDTARGENNEAKTPRAAAEQNKAKNPWRPLLPPAMMPPPKTKAMAKQQQEDSLQANDPWQRGEAKAAPAPKQHGGDPLQETHPWQAGRTTGPETQEERREEGSFPPPRRNGS